MTRRSRPRPPSTRFHQARVGAIIRDCADLLLPSFQRSYVWTQSDRDLLFDSLINRIPIGVATLWAPDGFLGRECYLLDGQQRITSMMRMLDRAETDPGFLYDLEPSPGIRLPLWAAADGMNMLDWLRDRFPRNRKSDQRKVRACCELQDLINSSPIGYWIIEGDEEYARSVYARTNTAGVPVNLDDIIGDDKRTVADQIELNRAA